MKFYFFALVLSVLSGCQTVSPKNGALPETTQTSYSVVDFNSGKVAADMRADVPTPLASVTKLFTAAAALETLGANFKFETKVFGRGQLRDGVWKGNLVLVGGGDPLLSVRNLMELASRLYSLGIRKVAGNVFYDAASFAGTQRIDTQMDLGAPYNSGVSALSVDFNQQPSADRRGRRVPIQDSAQHTAGIFVEFCRLLGIEIPDATSGAIQKGKNLAVHRSPPLSEIVDRMLEYSNNQVAELVLIAAAKKEKRQVTLDEAGEWLTRWTAKRINSPTLQLARGSGLSDKNVASPREVTRFLEWAGMAAKSELLFRLPTSGWNGTLQDRLGNTELRFKAWAKTGSLDYVSNISGYLFSKSGKRFAFSVSVWDEVLRARSRAMSDDDRREEAGRWAKQAAQSNEQLILDWYQRL